MKLRIIIVIALLVFPVFANPQKSKYVGFRHRGTLYDEIMSNGVKSLGGGLLSNNKFGVSLYTKNFQTMLWLERIIERDTLGVPNWEVRDVLNFGKLKKNESLQFSYSSTCRQNGRANVDLVVKTVRVPYAKYYKVEDAWTASASKGKFEKTSTRGIRCEVAAP